MNPGEVIRRGGSLGAASYLSRRSWAGALRAGQRTLPVTRQGLSSAASAPSRRPRWLCFEATLQSHVESASAVRRVSVDCVSAPRPWFQVVLGSLCPTTSYRSTGRLGKSTLRERERGTRWLPSGSPLRGSSSIISSLLVYKKRIRFLLELGSGKHTGRQKPSPCEPWVKSLCP